MNRGDIETFYPAEAGGLESSFCCAYTGEESSFDDLDDSKDDQESIEYEGEESQVGAMEPNKQLPCFRELVRTKKKELKDQYGRGKFQDTIKNEEKCLGGFVDIKGDGKGPIWNPNINCITVSYHHIAWIPGWRKEWRKFKRDGGLNAMKEQSVRCIAGTPVGNTPIIEPPKSPIPFNSGMTCQELAETFGISYKGGTPYGNFWGDKVKTGAKYKEILTTQLQNPNLSPEEIDNLKRVIADYGSGNLPVIGYNITPQEIRDEFIRKNCKPICLCKDGTKTAECCATYKPSYKKFVPNVSLTQPGQMNCAELAKNYNIVAGKSFGTANANAIQSWKSQNCTSAKVMQQIKEADEAARKEAGKPKRMIIIASIVAVIIIGAAIFYYYKGGKK